jgi:hypothetical protein
MALQPPVSPDPVSPSPAHTAVYRRLTRAFADLGITPVTVDDGSPTWVRVVNDNIAFGELSVATAARLATLLEDLAAGTSCPAQRVPWEPMITGPEYEIAVSGPFVPVASPIAPAAASSRFHPSVSS